MGTPTAEHQARFVTNLQRLLTEGQFVNTYKFALLLSLARWATENPDWSEGEPLDVRDLAPHFAECYWPHVQPFALPVAADNAAEPEGRYAKTPNGDWSQVLVPDRGQRSDHQVPSVLKEIRAARAEGALQIHQLSAARRDRLLGSVRRSIVEMPLWKLHRVRDSDSPMHFLYRESRSRGEIRFESGTVACLAHFAPLVEETVRAAWLRHVLNCNPHVLGAAATVETFLFPGSRASLLPWRRILEPLQGERCFYCEHAIRGTPVVDHFLPWSRYRRDLGHNFVLAHAECNQQKLDHLANPEHLERWCRRNEDFGAELAARFDAEHLPHDWPTLRRVSVSLYRLAEANGSSLWRRHRELVPIDARWRSILGVA